MVAKLFIIILLESPNKEYFQSAISIELDSKIFPKYNTHSHMSNFI